MDKINHLAKPRRIILSLSFPIMMFVLLIVQWQVQAVGYSSNDRAAPNAINTHGRGFIGVTDRGTLSLQNITLDHSAEFEIISYDANGIEIEKLPDTLATNSYKIFSAKATVNSSKVDGGKNLFGVNYRLSEQNGNTAYLAPSSDGHTDSILCKDVPGLTTPFTYCLSLPILRKAHENMTSEFFLQFEGEGPISDKERVLIQFYHYEDPNDFFAFSIKEEVFKLKPNGLLAVDLANLANVPPGFSGNGLVLSNRPFGIGSVRNNHTDNSQSAFKVDLDEQLPIGTQLVAPILFNNKDSQTTEICVGNTDNLNNFVTISYSDGKKVERAELFGAQTKCFDQADEGHADGWQGGAVISADGLIQAIVQIKGSGSASNGRWSYNLTPDFQVNTIIAFPILFGKPMSIESNSDEWVSTIHFFNFGPSELISH